MKHSMSGLYISTTEVAKYIPAWSQRYKKILNDEIKRLKNLTSLAELTLKTKRWKNNGHEVSQLHCSCSENAKTLDTAGYRVALKHYLEGFMIKNVQFLTLGKFFFR